MRISYKNKVLKKIKHKLLLTIIFDYFMTIIF